MSELDELGEKLDIKPEKFKEILESPGLKDMVKELDDEDSKYNIIMYDDAEKMLNALDECKKLGPVELKSVPMLLQQGFISGNNWHRIKLSKCKGKIELYDALQKLKKE